MGFEPTRACALPVFKTGAINRSTTPPDGLLGFGENCATAVAVSKVDRCSWRAEAPNPKLQIPKMLSTA